MYADMLTVQFVNHLFVVSQLTRRQSFITLTLTMNLAVNLHAISKILIKLQANIIFM